MRATWTKSIVIILQQGIKQGVQVIKPADEKNGEVCVYEHFLVLFGVPEMVKRDHWTADGVWIWLFDENLDARRGKEKSIENDG